MAHDEPRIREFARSYTDAWCSHDPTRVADHFVSGGTIAINGGDPTEVASAAHRNPPSERLARGRVPELGHL